MTQRGSADDLRQVASKIRGFGSAFRMMSGAFRAQIAEALGAAAKLEEERVALEADRQTIQRELDNYRTELASTGNALDEVSSLAPLSTGLRRVRKATRPRPGDGDVVDGADEGDD